MSEVLDSYQFHVCIDDKCLNLERVARLVAGLVAHERFWFYLAFFELGSFRVCR